MDSLPCGYRRRNWEPTWLMGAFRCAARGPIGGRATPRWGFSLLEVIIAISILATVMTLVTMGLQSGVNLRNHVEQRTTSDEDLNRLLISIGKDLRNAKVNEVWLSDSRAAWTTTLGGVTSYSFRTSTRFNPAVNRTDVASLTSFDRLLDYETGVVLSFAQDPQHPTRGRLTRSVWTLDANGALARAQGQDQLLTDQLLWSDAQGNPGFSIVDVLEATGDATRETDLGTGDEFTTGQSTYRRSNHRLKIVVRRELSNQNNSTGTPSQTLVADTTISLRQTMFDQEGVLAPVITGELESLGNQGDEFRYDIMAKNFPTAYGISALPPGLAIDVRTGVVSGTPTAIGTWNLTITAENSVGYDKKNLHLVISGPAPEITSALTVAVPSKGSVSYAVTATNTPTSFAAMLLDDSGDTLPKGLSFDRRTGILKGTCADDSYEIALTASNANGDGEATLTLNVGQASGEAPKITSVLSAVAELKASFAYVIEATNDPTSFEADGMPSWMKLNTSSGKLSGTPKETWSGSITIIATNAAGSDKQVLKLVVQQPVPVVSSSKQTAQVKTPFSYTISATNSPTSYAVVDAPSWMSAASKTGVISGTPDWSGTQVVTLVATNAYGDGKGTLTIEVQPQPAPVISSPASASGNATIAFSYQITASNSPMKFWAERLPAWLSVDNASGVISGTPLVKQSTTITVYAANESGSGSAEVALAIDAAPAAPGISLGDNTGNGANFSVLGVITAHAKAPVNYDTFVWSCSQTGFSIQLGWINPGKGSKAINANEFLITGKKPKAGLTITCSVSDSRPAVGTAIRVY